MKVNFLKNKKKMKRTKIITHEGIFHADEVLAIAYLRAIGVVSKDTAIERRNRSTITPEEMMDPAVLILDCGLQYAPALGNFDHHQDSSLEATNMLVLDYFTDDKKLVEKLTYSLFQYVSDIDRGVKSQKGESAGFNSIISNFNGSENAFENAIEIAETILFQYIRNAEAMILSDELWKTIPRICDGKVVALEKGEWIQDWKRLAEEEGVLLLVAPNLQTDGAWNITSRDSNLFPLTSHPGQTFLHNSKFFAVYTSKDEALEHAEILTKDVQEFVVGSKKTAPSNNF